MAIATRHDAQIGYAIAPDILSNEGGQLKSRGKVIFHSDFKDGSFDGWRDHQGGYVQTPCTGLTRYPVHSGSHALQLSTGAVPYASTLASRTTSAYKNLTMVRETGVLSYSGWFAHAGEANDASNGDVSFYSWGLSLDIQKHLHSAATRRFFQMQVIQSVDDQYPGLFLVAPDTGALTSVPGTSAGIIAGENEAKHNFNYMRLTVDLSGAAGLGSVVEAQINSRVFDLSGLGYTGSEPPQSGSAQKSFAGGMNAGINLARSVITTSYNINVLTADNLVVTQGDTLA